MGDRRPRVVMLLASAIDFDTRVKKEAVSLALAGCDVTVISRASKSEKSISDLHGVRVIRQPVPLVLSKGRRRRISARQSIHRALWPSTDRWRLGLDEREALRFAHWMEAVSRKKLEALAGLASPTGRVSEFKRRVRLAKAWARSESSFPRLRWKAAKGYEALLRLTLHPGKGLGWITGISIRRLVLSIVHRRWQRRYQSLTTPVPVARKRGRKRWTRRQGWERTLAYLVDTEIAFAQHLDKLRPDVIHAHDFFTLPMAIKARQRFFEQGLDVPVVYDSHEFVAGLGAHYSSEIFRSYLQMESDFIHHASAIVTVTDELAERLRDRYRLPAKPDVVINAPMAAAASSSTSATVRSVAALGEAVPLAVYVGNVNPNRGLDVMIESLPSVPELHVAIIATRFDDGLRKELIALAARKSVTDRVHLLDPVEPDEVVGYIAGADLGLIAIKSEVINHQLSLPNKLFEYLHAGLPVVTSDCEALAKFVRETEVGEVFESGNAGALALATRRVLDNPASYRMRITDDLLEAYSWESSQIPLIDLYSRLANKPLQSRSPMLPPHLTDGAAL